MAIVPPFLILQAMPFFLPLLRYPVLVFLCLLSLVVAVPAEVDQSDPNGNVRPDSRFIIHLEDAEQKATAESTLVNVAIDLRRMLGNEISYRPHIYIETDFTAFENRVGGNFPDWGAAAAIPEQEMMVIKSPTVFRLSRSLSELLGHELSHLWLADRLHSRAVPRWFDEGLAMSVSSEWRWSDNLAMSEATVFGQLIPLPDIERVNQFDEGEAQVAYAESYLAVRYFYDSYGSEAVQLFLDSLANGSDIDAALLVSTGSNYSAFNREYELYLSERFTLATLLMDTMYFWLILAIIVIVGAILKYRRRREYYARWEKEEELHSTDFDYGDPDNPEATEDDEPWRD